MDFTKYLGQKVPKFYGGGNGNKIAIKMDDQIYMLKFSAKDNKLNNDTNSSISEYLACHIFSSLGFDTQETILGTLMYKGIEKTVVACKDFTSIGIRLQAFAEIKNSCLDLCESGYRTELKGVLQAIDDQTIVAVETLKEYFWDMFIGDALLGNFDRHNGNWGFLINDDTQEIKMAPIYDCGSCLYSKISDDNIADILKDEQEILNRVYAFPNSALKINGKKINYFDFLHCLENKDCNRALQRIYPKIKIDKINQIIDETALISDIRKEFYKTMIAKRYELILTSAMEQLGLRKNDGFR